MEQHPFHILAFWHYSMLLSRFTRGNRAVASNLLGGSEAFKAREMLGGVWQIEEAMGVCTTLLCGTERALLVDTGYGLNDLCARLRTSP